MDTKLGDIVQISSFVGNLTFKDGELAQVKPDSDLYEVVFISKKDVFPSSKGHMGNNTVVQHLINGDVILTRLSQLTVIKKYHLCPTCGGYWHPY